MSTPANSGIDICSRALVLIGAEPITSFSDGTTESLVSSNMYEDVARTNLTSTRWRFATNQAVLNRLSAAPTGRYDAAYQLPSGYLYIHAITVNDLQIEYDLYGDKAYCDANVSDSLIADYTFRADEQNWPSYFCLTVEYAMASVFATAIARDTALADQMNIQYERMLC